MTTGVGTGVRLRVQDLYLAFGGLEALVEISVEVREGEILAIIGPNGAGKTALLKCINGFYRPQKGDIFSNCVEIATAWYESRSILLQ